MNKGILSRNFPISVAVHLDYRQPELLEELRSFSVIKQSWMCLCSGSHHASVFLV